MKTIIKVEYDDVILSEDENKIEISPIINGKEYFPTSVIEDKYQITRQTLNNYTKKLHKQEKKDYVFKYNGRKYYCSGVIFLNPNHSKRMKRQPYAKWLSQYTWDYAITVSFPDTSYSSDVIRKFMVGYWNKLVKQIGTSRLNLFYCTERYPDGHGYHSHGIIRVMDEKLKGSAITIARKYFRQYKGDVLIEELHTEADWVSYVIKQLNINPDGYDILYHRGTPTPVID